MSSEITKELKEWARRGLYRGGHTQKELLAIADRIDRAHGEEKEAAWRLGFDEGFNSADDWYAEKSDDELAEHDLMRLPRDSQGRAWHVGDEADVAGKKSYVVALTAGSVLVAPGPGMWNQGVSFPSENIGHHEPTIAERVRAWCQAYRESGLRDGALEELDAIADELEGATE